MKLRFLTAPVFAMSCLMVATVLPQAASAQVVPMPPLTYSASASFGNCSFTVSNSTVKSTTTATTQTNDPDCRRVYSRLVFRDRKNALVTKAWVAGKFSATTKVTTALVFEGSEHAVDLADGTRKTTTVMSPSRRNAVASRVVEIARGEIGKAGEYSLTGYWCGKFVSWVYKQAQVPGVIPDNLYPTAYWDATERGWVTDKPQVGGAVMLGFSWDQGRQILHIGIIESVNGNKITTIERSPDGPANSPNDVVVRKNRNVTDAEVKVFLRFG